MIWDLWIFLETRWDHDIIIGGYFNGAPMEWEIDKERTVAWPTAEYELIDAHT